MKNLLLTSIILIAFTFSYSAKGIPLPYCSDCEYITIVEDLPDSLEFYSEEYGAHIDLAFKYNQFWALWVPIWNTNGTYCYSIEGQDVYFDLSAEELKGIAEKYNFTISENPIPFWDKIGGKIVLIVILGAIIWGQIKPKEEEKEA